MKALQRVLGIYSMLLAIVVGLHFIVTPLYDDGSSGFPVWQVFNYPMAVAVIIALVFGFLQKRALDASGNGGDLRRHLDVNALFYASVWLTIWYFWSWFTTLMGRGDPHWEFTDPLFVVVAGAAGLRLWRAP